MPAVSAESAFSAGSERDGAESPSRPGYDVRRAVDRGVGLADAHRVERSGRGCRCCRARLVAPCAGGVLLTRWHRQTVGTAGGARGDGGGGRLLGARGRPRVVRPSAPTRPAGGCIDGCFGSAADNVHSNPRRPTGLRPPQPATGYGATSECRVRARRSPFPAVSTESAFSAGNGPHFGRARLGGREPRGLGSTSDRNGPSDPPEGRHE